MSHIVSTQIVEPLYLHSDHLWIPLEETHPIDNQKHTSINSNNWKVIVTHLRAFEHYKHPISKDIPILCVGQRTQSYLKSLGYNNVTHHDSAVNITVEDRYYHLWLHGDKVKVNFSKGDRAFRENVVACKTYSTSPLKENIHDVLKICPQKIYVYSQVQYEILEESGYIPDTLIIVPSIKINKDIWKKIITLNPA